MFDSRTKFYNVLKYKIFLLGDKLLLSYRSASLDLKGKCSNELPNRAIMLTNNIIDLLGLCLNNTYSQFQGQYFEQTKGSALE